MKTFKIFTLVLVTIFGLTACEGDRGPQGPPGQDGNNGYIGTTTEFTIDFPLNNEFIYVFADDGIEVFESDAVLVYRSEESIADPSGPIKVWKQLPQTIYFNNGTELAYNFDHTFNDVRLFVEGTADFNAIDPNIYFNNQHFRIVVVPADFAKDPKIDLSSFESLQKAVKNRGKDLQKVSLQTK
ncbi:LptM family lipoprotein [Haloflavibacter putidus]|uniref:Collagen-like protein n=1 Tax=Haloflavibacter putidus TaxID=2576776 RepID=A0A507ZU47_9FLAO|nr:hypothetical protein [Haloflavibacter putidus]TQD39268.1 hypothetical protein FKR84_05050 [Haloflavibacter putidus]